MVPVSGPDLLRVSAQPQWTRTMSVVMTSRGIELFYKDWGDGPPVVFCHGWPLNADMWEYQMSFLAPRGYRCIAFDRRGFGRSSQPWDGLDFDSFADDLASLLQSLDLVDAVLVGWSIGANEIVRYIGRHGTSRVRKVVLLGAPLPRVPSPGPAAPDPRWAVLASIPEGLAANRQAFLARYGSACFGFHHSRPPGAAAVLDWAFALAMQASPNATRDSILALLQGDFRADLAAIDVPVLLLHGEDDVVIPCGATAPVAAGLIRTARLVTIPAAPHGLWLTDKDRVNGALLAFLRRPT